MPPLPSAWAARRAPLELSTLLLAFFLAASYSSLAAQTPVDAGAEATGAGAVKADAYNDQTDPNAKPVNGGTVVFRFSTEPKTLSSEIDSSAMTQYVVANIYETLIERNPETYEFAPLACESFVWEDLVVRKDGTILRGNAEDQQDQVVVRPPKGEAVSVARADLKEVRKGASMTFYMRKGATWHDGKPVTARDVVFSYKAMANPVVGATSVRSYLTDIQNVELLDEMTVRYTYSKQYWAALETAGNLHMIYPEHLFDPDGLMGEVEAPVDAAKDKFLAAPALTYNVGTGITAEMQAEFKKAGLKTVSVWKDPETFGKRFNEHERHGAPIGSGPYRFQAWQRGSSLTLQRYVAYNGTWKPHIDKIVYRFITENVAAIQALKNGDVDFNFDLTPEQFDVEGVNAPFTKDHVVTKYFIPNFGFVAWNLRKVPFNEKLVRQALAYGALDKDLFNKEILKGRAVSIEGDQYCFAPAYDRNIKPYPFDKKKAEELLRKAGWIDHDGDGLRDKDGVPFKFELLSPQFGPNDPAARRVAIIIENLKRLGIQMTVKMLEWTSFTDRLDRMDFDACQLSWAMSPENDPYQNWHSSQTGEKGSNFTGFVNEDADKLIEASRLEMDAKKRAALFIKLQGILHEEQPYLFMFCNPDYLAYGKKLRGVKIYTLRPGYDVRDWWIPKELQ